VRDQAVSRGNQARRIVADQLQELIRSRPTKALPEDIFLVALARYDAGATTSAVISQSQKAVAAVIQEKIKDANITLGRRKSLSRRYNSAIIVVFHPTPLHYRTDQVMLGAYIHAFAFWQHSLWAYSAVDPTLAVAHLHERIVKRSNHPYRNFAEAQDRLSDLVPLLVEVGQRRRLRGIRANIDHFVTPWSDGLMFGDFSKLPSKFGTPQVSANPELMEFIAAEKTGYLHQLSDIYADDQFRLCSQIRTFVGPNEMKAHQIQLFHTLSDFCETHRTAIEFLKLKKRLGVGADQRFAPELLAILAPPRPTDERALQAIEEFDQLTSSDLWLSEVKFSKRNRRSGSEGDEPIQPAI